MYSSSNTPKRQGGRGKVIHALSYAKLWWPVFPVHSIVNGVCTCRKGARCPNPGKHPRTRNGVKAATTDQKRIRRWWTKHPESNIGVPAGEASGLVVLDLDDGGQQSLQELIERLGELPPCPTARTGGGGFHLLFGHPGRAVPNRIGLVEGIDVRADGGYIVAPESDHISGGVYRWAVPPTSKPPELPTAWLVFICDGQSLSNPKFPPHS